MQQLTHYLRNLLYISQHIETIIKQYQGAMPLAYYLKNYFKSYPKLGSRDRRMLSEMAYTWYRFSKGFDEKLAFRQKLDACLYLSESTNPHIIALLPEVYQNKQQLSRDERWQFLAHNDTMFQKHCLVSFIPALSPGITPFDWISSILIQPMLFIRVVKNKEQVTAILKENQIDFETHTITYKKADGSVKESECFSFKNGVAIDKLLPADSYVVQDISSQSTGQYFLPAKDQQWLDCCSGAGGKSLLLKYIEPKTNLSVSDTRETIIRNLKDRFKQYGLTAPATFIADARDKAALTKNFGTKKFDSIICDVPCTGSGTWARTPEQLYFFRQGQIQEYAERQKQIAANAIDLLKPGGRLIYITCSVFKAENEDVLDFLEQQKQITILEKKLINGLSQKADSMFVAVLAKS